MSYSRKGDRDYLVSLEDWEKFYAVAQQLSLSGDEMEDAIVRRIVAERALPWDKAESLKLLLREEQEETTASAIRKYGSPQALRDWATTPNAKELGFWEELSRVREAVRRSFDPKYRSHFDESVMTLVNEHLRNQVIRLETRFLIDGPRCRVRGVGR